MSETPATDFFEEEIVPPVFQPADTPLKRLRQVFRKSELGIRSCEMAAAWKAAEAGFLAGLSVGGIRVLSPASQTWKKTHTHSVFLSHTDAGRYHLNYISRRFITDGGKLGIRVGIFCGISVLTITSIAARRNEARMYDFAVGGALAGALQQIYVGPKAMLATAILGGVFWQLVGFLLIPVFRFGGHRSLDDFYKEARQFYYQSLAEKAKLQRELGEIADEQGTKLMWPSTIKQMWAERKLIEEERLVEIRSRNKESQILAASAPAAKMEVSSPTIK